MAPGAGRPARRVGRRGSCAGARRAGDGAGGGQPWVVPWPSRAGRRAPPGGDDIGRRARRRWRRRPGPRSPGGRRRPRRCMAGRHAGGRRGAGAPRRSPRDRPTARSGWATRRTATGGRRPRAPAPRRPRRWPPTISASATPRPPSAVSCTPSTSPSATRSRTRSHTARWAARSSAGGAPALWPWRQAQLRARQRVGLGAQRHEAGAGHQPGAGRRRHQPVDHADHRHDRRGVDVAAPALVVEADVAAHDRQPTAPGRPRPCRRWPRTAATSSRGARGCRS